MIEAANAALSQRIEGVGQQTREICDALRKEIAAMIASLRKEIADLRQAV